MKFPSLSSIQASIYVYGQSYLMSKKILIFIESYFRLLMQIMECCYYLNNLSAGKTNDVAKKEDDSNFVRLLTGSRTLCTLTDADVTVPKDKSMKQMPFNIAVVKKSTGRIPLFCLPS